MALGPNEFRVKVRTGPLKLPVFMKRSAIMKLNEEKKDIAFSFNNCCTVISTESLEGLPSVPPRGTTLRFLMGSGKSDELMIEFEDHDAMVNAYNKLKDSCLEMTQAAPPNSLKRSRGLYTNTGEPSSRNLKVQPDTPVRQGHVRRIVEKFRELIPCPEEKRLKQPITTTLVDLGKSCPKKIASSLRPSEWATSKKETQEQIGLFAEDEEKHEKYVKQQPTKLDLQGVDTPTQLPKRESLVLQSTSRDNENESPNLGGDSSELFELAVIPDKRPSKHVVSSVPVSGFANLGNTCYMNSMLQGLFAVDFFSKDLFKFCKKIQGLKVDLADVMPLSSALSSLASKKERGTNRVKKTLLQIIENLVVNRARFKSKSQQDAHEFLVNVLNEVQEECDKLLRQWFTDVKEAERRKHNPVTSNFAFVLEADVTCEGCHHVSKSKDESIFLPVGIDVLEQAGQCYPARNLKMPTVQTLLDGYLKSERIDRKCERCQFKGAQMTQKFSRLPRCLIIFIKRYTYSEATRKRDDEIGIPMYLTLDGHCSEGTDSYPVVPASTKKIDFLTASPIKRKLFMKPNDESPLKARRRLYVPDDPAASNENISPTIENGRTSAGIANGRIDKRFSSKVDLMDGASYLNEKLRGTEKAPVRTGTEGGALRDETQAPLTTDIAAFAERSSILDENHSNGPDNTSIQLPKLIQDKEEVNEVVADALKKCVDITEESVLPSAGVVKPVFSEATSTRRLVYVGNNSNAPKLRASSDYTYDDLSFMTEEEQIQAACERSLTEHSESYRSRTGSFRGLSDESQQFEEEIENPRELSPDDKDNDPGNTAQDTNLQQDIEMTEEKEADAVNCLRSLEARSPDQSDSAATVGQKKEAKESNYPLFEICPDDKVESSGDDAEIQSEGKGGARRKTYVKTPTKPRVEEKLVKIGQHQKQSQSEPNETNFPTRPATPVPLPQSEVDIPTRPATPVLLPKQYSTNPMEVDIDDQIFRGEKSPDSVISDDLRFDHGKDIIKEYGPGPVPYKPLSSSTREAICARFNLLFHFNRLEETSIRHMSVHDRPAKIGVVEGDGNCLFRALAFYFSGTDIEHRRVRETIVEFEMEHAEALASLKGWENDKWNAHINGLLANAEWGTEVELFAVASMLHVDVWTFYKNRWLCYRPRFEVHDGMTMPINITDYCVGENEGIYLLNDACHFSPVLSPSDETYNKEVSYNERICKLEANAFDGFMKPSYRLVSVVSHIGSTSESGHYVCDVWCNRRKTWLFCDDENIRPVNISEIRNRSDVGYIYFYVNNELLENE